MPAPPRSAVVLSIALLACGTRGGGSGGGDPARPARADAATATVAAPRPLYALVDGPAEPLAIRLCAALHGARAARRSACCATPDPGGAGGAAEATGAAGDPTPACTRLVSLALRGGALEIDADALERCAPAMQALHEGCDWVGFDPLPAPLECRGVARGTLPPRAGCRSSVECAGTAHCAGLVAGGAGTCKPPQGHFARCLAPRLTADDPLAGLLLDDRLDETHPECQGHCERGRCATPITAKGPCEDSRQCAPGAHCVKQRCLAGWRPKLGEACKDACERPARCVRGTCAAALRAGVPCSIDDECVGRCLRENDGGRCGPACGRR